MTTLENALQSQIDASDDDLRRNCLKAELAAHLARLGRYEVAKSIVTDIRSIQFWGSPEMTSLVLMAEAMIQLEDEFDLGALDRLTRAFAISNAAKLDRIATGVAAWLGHFNFNRNQFTEMRKWFSYCNDRKESLSPSTIARVCLTLANATRYSGEFGASDRWYARSRQEAVRIGDEAFLAASMYNRAALGIAGLRVSWTKGDVESTLVDRSQLEIESASNYSKATKNSAARHLQGLWLGRLFQIKGQHRDALQLLEVALVALPEATNLALRQTIVADIAFSKSAIGDTDAASQLLSASPLAAIDLLDTDDRVVYLFQLTEIAAALSPTIIFDALSDQFRDAVAAHGETSSSLARQLGELDFQLI